MSKKHSYATADYLPWDAAVALIRRLYRDKNYRMSLLIGCGCFFGLRISDLRQLTWRQILDKDEMVLWEQKTGKRRVVRINKGFQGHIRDCYNAMMVRNDESPCFLNRYGSTISLQMINREFKSIKVRYKLKIDNFSTHTMRKTWARQIWEMENANGRGDMALLKLSELMNHSAPNITRRYIGLRQQELGEVYNSLQF
ncbi:MAG: tyrosine-type recombinase/integrase [Bacteroidales bacterium]|nr:tyrosine-type recombinase/integrase [Bacteroidales bacterium]